MKKTPLYDSHIALKARMVDYHGWSMPVSYEGIIQEHKAVRESAGLFDVSHMGIIDFSGKDVLSFLNYITVNDVSRLKDYQAQYSMLPEKDGDLIDDIILTKYPTFFRMVVNASNRQKDWDWITEQAEVFEGEVFFKWRDDLAIIALQGPEADVYLKKVGMEDCSSLKSFNVKEIEWHGTNITVSATGYTGEHGYELFIPEKSAVDCWMAFIDSGVEPIGLGARDSLRIEAGFPLYGQEIQSGISPFDLNYGWTVKLDKESFIGKSRMMKAREKRKWLIGVQLDGRAIARTGCRIKEGGVVTSGTFSPVLNFPIALALVEQPYSEGDEITLMIRKNEVSARVRKLPFLDKKKS